MLCTAFGLAPLIGWSDETPPARLLFDFETPAAVTDWRSKTNTSVEWCSQSPRRGRGCLRFTIDPAKFTYGWIHRDLPGPLPRDAAGIHGWFRSPKGASGTLRLYIVRGLPGEPTYYGAEIGRLDESEGLWMEFFVRWSDLEIERGRGAFPGPEALTKSDLIQFLASVGRRTPVQIDVDAVDAPSEPDAGAIRERVRLARLHRLLRPLPRAGIPSGVGGRAPHPRLLLTDAAVAALRKRTQRDPQVRAVLDQYVDNARRIIESKARPLDALLEFTADSDLTGTPWRAGFEGRVRTVCRTIEQTAAAWRLTGDRKFAEFAKQRVLPAAQRLPPDFEGFKRGFYYTRSFWVRTLAFAYDWLWPVLSEGERRGLQTVLLDFVFDIHGSSQTGGWGRRPLHRVWNWDPGLMGACGLAMLALEGETRTAEEAILFDCRRHVRDYLTLGIDFDGCGHEGPNYLGYGIGSAVHFAEILREQGRGDLFTETNWRLIPVWLAAETLPGGGRWNNLSDCGHGQQAAPVLTYTCGRLAALAANDPPRDGERWSSDPRNQPLDYLQHFSETPGPLRLSYGALAKVMEWVWRNGPGRVKPTQFGPESMLAWLLWYRPLPRLDDPQKFLDPTLHFRGRGLVVCRTGYGPDDVYISVEAGPHAAGHDQADKGSFTLYAYGADLAIDSGYGNDGDPYKSGSSFAHNVVLIDGRGQPMRYHNQSNGWITGFLHSKALDWIRADARDAWSFRYDRDWNLVLTHPVRRAERQFVFVRPADGIPPYLVVFDDIAKDRSRRLYTWQWHLSGIYEVDLKGRPWTTRPAAWCSKVLTSTPNMHDATAEFEVRINERGRYILVGLVRAGGPTPGKSDSFFVHLDDGPRLLWDLHTGREFRWAAVQDRAEDSPHVFDLALGVHRIRIEQREPQAELARMVVLPVGSPLPDTPDAVPPGALALAATDARPGSPGLLLVETSKGPRVYPSRFSPSIQPTATHASIGSRRRAKDCTGA